MITLIVLLAFITQLSARTTVRLIRNATLRIEYAGEKILVPTLYIMGDCLWDERTRMAVETYKPDYIAINTGGNIFIPQSLKDGDITMNEMEAMQMTKACDPHIRFIADHMDAVDHCQTSRVILRNQAMYDKVDRNRLSIPEDGETIVLK